MIPPVLALGITQIVGYGTLYYAFPILVPKLVAAFGASPALLFGIFSAGLVLAGVAAPMAGRAMDRIGAPRLMAGGSAAVTVLLAALPLAPGIWTLAALLIALELAAVLVLYDAAFATLALLRGAGARRAITQLTLIAGFASTLFWPLTGWLVEHWGWQATYLVFAGLNAGIALPLHLGLVRGARGAQGPAVAPAAPLAPALTGPAAVRAFWLLATSFALSGMLISALGVHLVPVLQTIGLGAAAYGVSMLMGPAQVAIRLADAVFWRGLHPLDVALISAAALPLAVVALLATDGAMAGAAAFAIVFGVGQGLSSIVRGSVPLALFGTAGFGERLGRLAAIRAVLGALAPAAFALLLAGAGTHGALAVALGIGVAGIVPLALLRLSLRRPADGAAA